MTVPETIVILLLVRSDIASVTKVRVSVLLISIVPVAESNNMSSLGKVLLNCVDALRLAAVSNSSSP